MGPNGGTEGIFPPQGIQKKYMEFPGTGGTVRNKNPWQNKNQVVYVKLVSQFQTTQKCKGNQLVIATTEQGSKEPSSTVLLGNGLGPTVCAQKVVQFRGFLNRVWQTNPTLVGCLPMLTLDL